LGLQLANSNVASTSGGGANAVIKVTTIHGVSVLTNKHGFTLYWFVPDTVTVSACYSTCAAYWPPVLGKPSPGAGIQGSFGTLKRSNGASQVTYNGHPLYTYIGDSAPGQASGNRVRLNGGLWYEMKASK
jgi:predicted lipoprotein with Yx(FWY)xxD motif